MEEHATGLGEGPQGRTRNAEFERPLPDVEVVPTARSVWKHLETGRLHLGTPAEVRMSVVALAAFGGNGDVYHLHSPELFHGRPPEQSGVTSIIIYKPRTWNAE